MDLLTFCPAPEILTPAPPRPGDFDTCLTPSCPEDFYPCPAPRENAPPHKSLVCISFAKECSAATLLSVNDFLVSTLPQIILLLLVLLKEDKLLPILIAGH